MKNICQRLNQVFLKNENVFEIVFFEDYGVGRNLNAAVRSFSKLSKSLAVLYFQGKTPGQIEQTVP